MPDDNKTKLKTKSIRLPPPGRLIALVILIPLLTSCLLSRLNLHEQVQGAIAAGLFILLLMYFSTRRADPRYRWLNLAILLPVAIGFILHVYFNDAIAPLVIGIGITIALGVGRYFHSYPPEYRKAVKLCNKRDYAEALELASIVMQKKPDKWESYHLRSTIYRLMYQFEDAKRDAQKAIELNPGISYGYVALGLAEKACQNYDKAISAFDRAIELSPKSPLNHYIMGATLYRQAQYAEAEPYLTAALRGSLRSEEVRMLAYLYLGKCLLKLEDTKRAKEALANLRYYKNAYEWLLRDLEAAPDLPSVLALRQDLDEIYQYVSTKP